MRFRDCLVVWTPARSTEWATAGKVKVGPHPDLNRWSKEYRMSAGAAFLDRKTMPHWQLVAMMFTDFHTIVVRDGIDAQVAHQAFLEIDEYREIISPDISGADLED